MSESESLEEASNTLQLQDGTTLAKTLELLDDQQTMQLVRVIAEDSRMKCDLYSLVRWRFFEAQFFGTTLNFLFFRETKRNFTEIDRRFPARRDRCTFCHQLFGRKRKGQKCTSCERFLCKNCIQNEQCQCCLAMERAAYKEEEFKVNVLKKFLILWHTLRLHFLIFQIFRSYALYPTIFLAWPNSKHW